MIFERTGVDSLTPSHFQNTRNRVGSVPVGGKNKKPKGLTRYGVEPFTHMLNHMQKNNRPTGRQKGQRISIAIESGNATSILGVTRGPGEFLSQHCNYLTTYFFNDVVYF